MTPKEKTEQLVNQFRIVLMNEDTDCGNEILCSRIAKQCALIAVDEILDNNCGSTTDYGVDAEDNELYMDEYFWMEVKEEIKKL